MNQITQQRTITALEIWQEKILDFNIVTITDKYGWVLVSADSVHDGQINFTLHAPNKPDNLNYVLYPFSEEFTLTPKSFNEQERKQAMNEWIMAGIDLEVDDDPPETSGKLPAASVERIEDLAPVRIEIMVDLAARSDRGRFVFKPHRDYLESLGLIVVKEDNAAYITDKGNEWVADYQQQHMSDGQFDEYIAGKNAQASAERQPAGSGDTFHAKLLAGASSVQAVYTPERIEALEAEVKRLRELRRTVEAFLDDYGDWMPDQHTIQVSDKDILTLTNAFDASK